MKHFFDEKSDPHSLVAEQLVLSEILLDKTTKELIFSRLTAEVFYIQAHKLIYQSAIALHAQNRQVNWTTVLSKLGETNELEYLGGEPFLLSLINQVVPSGSVESYIISLTDKHLRRCLIKTAHKIEKLGYEDSDSVETLFDKAEQLLSSLTQVKVNSGLLPASEVLLETFIDLEKKSRRGNVFGLSSGFFDLDTLTQGFQKSDLIIIAGRPSMGKTAFALNLARNISEAQTFPVAIFSLEMSSQQIMYRLLSSESQISNSRLRSGKISTEEWKLVNKAIKYLTTLQIYLDDSSSNSINEIKSKISRLKSTHIHVGAVIIDYLQLISEDSYKNNRVQELSRITRVLKGVAREFELPLIVLSQLSRTVDSRINKRPLLSDLRESGCLAQESKIYLPDVDCSISILELSKNLSFRHILGMDLAFDKPIVSSGSFKRSFFTGHKSTQIVYSSRSHNINVTLNHKILTTKGWSSVFDLNRVQGLAILDRHNCKFLLFNSIVSFLTILLIFGSAQVKVYDVWTPELGNILSNDIFVHNSIEQDADVVLMLYRESYYSTSNKVTNVTEVILAKQRNGPIGVVNLIFDPKVVSFGNFVLL